MKINDTARLANDLLVTTSTLAPEIDLQKIEVRLEEVLSNYLIEHKAQQDIENDLKDKIEVYLSARKVEGCAKNTLDGHRLELSKFAEFANKAAVQVTTSDIRKYLASNPNWMMSTVGNKLSRIKTFFAWLVQEEMLLRDPSAKIKPPKLPKRLPRGISIEELEIVRDACESLRERALAEVLYSTGCRLSEIEHLKIADINAQDMSARVIGKGNKERIVYISIKAMHQLRKYLVSRKDDCEYVFVTERRPYRKMSDRAIQRAVDKIEKRANLNKPLTPHVFRHTFATISMQNGADLADVQHLLGHENPETTLVYAHVPEERKKQAHKRFHVQEESAIYAV